MAATTQKKKRKIGGHAFYKRKAAGSGDFSSYTLAWPSSYWRAAKSIQVARRLPSMREYMRRLLRADVELAISVGEIPRAILSEIEEYEKREGITPPATEKKK